MSHPAAGIPLLLSALAWGVYMLVYEVLAKTTLALALDPTLALTPTPKQP